MNMSVLCYNILSDEMKNDLEMFLLIIQKNMKFYQRAQRELKNHIEVIKYLIQSEYFEYIEDIEKWKNIKETALELCIKDGFYLEQINPEFLEDKEFLLEIASRSKDLYHFYQIINEKFKNDIDIILASLRNNGVFIRFIPKKYQNDLLIIQESIDNNTEAIYEIDQEIISSNEELVKLILFNYTIKPPYSSTMVQTVLNIIPQKFHHLPLIKQAIKVCPRNIFYAHDDILKDRELLVYVFSQIPHSIKHFKSMDLLSDFQFILDVYKLNPHHMLLKKLSNNEEFIYECIEYNPDLIKDLSDQVKTKRILLKLLKIGTKYFQYFPKEIKEDFDIYIVKNGMYLLFYNPKMKEFNNIHFNFK